MNIRWAVALWAVSGIQAADFHVTPDGRPGGSGSASSPWDLVTALKHPAAVLPGDTIWVHGGVYRAPAGNNLTGGYRSSLKGARNKPIYLRAVPGERAILDGRDSAFVPVITINGEWTWYWGLEVTNSDPNRRATTNASNGPGTRGAGLAIYGSNVKLVNSVIHDAGTAIGFWQNAVDSELYGNIVFNNGWISPQRAHGHGLYTQNLDGVKTIRDNFYFNQLAGGVQIYGTDNSYLRNFLFKGNTIFNDGFIASGGNGGVWNLLFSTNALYAGTCSFMDHVHTGKSLRVEDNYFGQLTVGLARVDRAEFSGNTFIRRPGSTLNIDMAVAPGTPLANHLFDRNSYQLTPKESRVMKVSDTVAKSSRTLTFAQMQQEGQEKNGSAFVAEAPQDVKVFLRPNEYEPGRAHLTIFNWSKQKSVTVSLAGLAIQKGDRYEIRNVQNYFAERLTGIFNGTSIQVPMTGWSSAPPIGLEEPVAPNTFPTFGAFLLTWKQTAQPPAVNSAASKWLPVASGSLAECLGENLAASVSSAPGGQSATELDGTSLRIVDGAGREHAAPLFSVSPERIAFQVPEAIAPGYAAVRIHRGGKAVAEASLMAAAGAAPGIFSATGEGTGPALCSYTVSPPDAAPETRPCSRCEAGICEALPVDFTGGEVTLSLYGTGIRNADTGSISVSVAGEVLTPDSMTPVAETPGLDLVNVRLPATLSGKGESEVVLAAGGVTANPVTINLQ